MRILQIESLHLRKRGKTAQIGHGRPPDQEFLQSAIFCEEGNIGDVRPFRRKTPDARECEPLEPSLCLHKSCLQGPVSFRITDPLRQPVGIPFQVALLHGRNGIPQPIAQHLRFPHFHAVTVLQSPIIDVFHIGRKRDKHGQIIRIKNGKLLSEGVDDPSDLFLADAQNDRARLSFQHIGMRGEIGPDLDLPLFGRTNGSAVLRQDLDPRDLVKAKVRQNIVVIEIADQIVTVVCGNDLIGIDLPRRVPNGVQLLVDLIFVIIKRYLPLVRHCIVELLQRPEEFRRRDLILPCETFDRHQRIFEMPACHFAEFYDEFLGRTSRDMPRKDDTVHQKLQFSVLEGTGDQVDPALRDAADLKPRILQKFQIAGHRFPLHFDPVIVGKSL